MKRIVVLGCGLVGSVMAGDLAADPQVEVTAVDLSEANLARLRELPKIKLRRADLGSAQEIAAAVSDADAVVGAVPGRLGFSMLETVIASGKPISDISFSPEDPLTLDSLAREKGVTAVVDCGVSPGLSNLAIGRASSQLSTVSNAVIYVGGLPVERHWPYEYRSVFSPTDVIEEYTRPARLVEKGDIVVREALSEIELIEFPGVGTLEAFNTDGLRTLLTTTPAHNMKEKTLRYPGHAERMRMLRETGFFSDTVIDLNGSKVVPRQLTERLLFSAWHKPPEEEELTVLRVLVEGTAADGRKSKFLFDLLDRTDRKSGQTSMARTTGFPCAIVARMLATGAYRQPGVRPPEMFGGDAAVYGHIVAELVRRNVHLREQIEPTVE